MTETQKGWVALLLAQSLWGISPLYYKVMAMVPATEILAHRTIWTFVLFGIWIVMNGRLGEFWRLISGPQQRKVIFAALFISINWGLFIYSVQSGQALEAAFGYYVFPLVATLVGVVVFKERLYGLQYVAILLAVVAVLVLGIGIGSLPWIALTLAVTFSIYGAIKKTLVAGPFLSVAAEVVFLVPLALIGLVGIHLYGWGGTETQAAGNFGASWYMSLMLIASGVVTGVPLIFFAAAARRLPLNIVGMGQYINSTIQFLIAVFIFSEPFTHWHAIAMPLIWTALVLYTLEVLRQDRSARRARKAATNASTVSTVSK
ncbi:EamA family transporter RarD [Celeribacter naphthalenivorans]|uniref:EamA family transporter RarD n=1 Tax=Celeribacter naphthalenivorans TaxID=1614694 RepID=UPI001CF93886|nr:EamA family transporter RarD [Celeribacter naphthalenivorans]